jgi:hypothetical protein
MKVTVNGTELDLAPGTSAIDAVFAAGYDVPYFCSQEYMSPIGACRMCLAKVGAPRKDRDGSWILDDETGEPKIFYFPNHDGHLHHRRHGGHGDRHPLARRQGRPERHGRVHPHQPPARLPGVRQGRRLRAAGPRLRVRHGPLALRLRQAPPGEAPPAQR